MIEYEEDWLLCLLAQWKGSVAGRALHYAVPGVLLTLFLMIAEEQFPEFREATGLSGIQGNSQLWNASVAAMSVLLAFRTNRAYARFWEGTGLLHQMRGEWFDAVSCCVTFSRAARNDKLLQVTNFRHTLVRLMSICHGSALAEISSVNSDTIETIDAFGLNGETLQHLKMCKQDYDFNRVEALLHMIQTLITSNLDEGVLKIPPPILSRVYQTLSRGFVNLLNAKKIADTRFPFPYAQLIVILLSLNFFMIPIMVTSFVTHKLWACVFTFIPIFAFYSLDFIATELENPFGDDDNDLPLVEFQAEMNNCLLMFLEHHADICPGISEARCIKDFDILTSRMSNAKCAKDVENSAELKKSESGSLADQNGRFARLTQWDAFVKSKSMSSLSVSDKPSKMSLQEAFERLDEVVELDGDPDAAGIGSMAMPVGTLSSNAFHGERSGSAEAFASSEVPSELPRISHEGGASNELPISEEAEASASAINEPRVSNAQPVLDESEIEVKPPETDWPMLARSMDEFNASLDRWTAIIEIQVAEISKNFAELKGFSSSAAGEHARQRLSQPIPVEMGMIPPYRLSRLEGGLSRGIHPHGGISAHVSSQPLTTPSRIHPAELSTLSDGRSAA